MPLASVTSSCYILSPGAPGCLGLWPGQNSWVSEPAARAASEETCGRFRACSVPRARKAQGCHRAAPGGPDPALTTRPLRHHLPSLPETHPGRCPLFRYPEGPRLVHDTLPPTRSVLKTQIPNFLPLSPSIPSAPATGAPSLSPQHARPGPAPGPLHRLCSLTRGPFLRGWLFLRT